MSGFTIPNTPDSSVANQNQAEPDSLDFQILGKQVNGVVSGMTVTVSTGGSTIDVASGEVLINGAYYSYAGITNFPVSTYSSSNFFDVVVARFNGTSVVPVVLPGNTGVNPRFPSVTHTTDVVLAAIWRTGSSMTSNEVVDKRVFVRSNSNRVGATATGGNHADTWVQPTTWTPNATLEGPLSVNVNGTWYKLSRYSADFTAGTITATNFVGNLTGNVTGNVSGNAGSVTNGVYNNSGTYSINITGTSSYSSTAGYLNGTGNVDPLGGPYLGWSPALNGWSVVGRVFFGDNLFYGISFTNTSSSTRAMVVNSDGRVAFNSTLSLRDHKENIQDLVNSLDIVNSLQPRTFIFKESHTDMNNAYEVFTRREQLQYGFIVEEVMDVNPDFIHHEQTGEGIKPQMWKHHALIAVLVGAVKELSARVEALEAQ